MVLQPAGPRSFVPDRSGSHPRRPRPDPSRIAGISGTLVFNVLLLMLLLVPMSSPDLFRVSSPKDPDLIWIEPKPKPPTPPPVIVDVIKPKPVQQPQTRVQPDVVMPPVDQLIVDQGTIAADPPADNSTIVANATPTIEPSGPVAGIRLEYSNAPAPTYPREQLLAGIEGTVLLQVLVDVDGRPLEVTIQRSSGNRDLDAAARRQVLRKWTFRPAMKDGRAVQAIGIVPIDFNLDRG
jgi:protein TonB